MKILVVLACSLTTLARCSLEPAGYKPPGTYTQTRYLPPSSGNHRPDNRYTSLSLDLSSQNVDAFTNQLSRSLSLPSQSEPVPFSNYLPANRQASDQLDYQSAIVDQTSNNDLPHYHPASEIQHSFTQALPRNRYLSAVKKPAHRREHSFSELYQSPPDRTYPSSDQRLGHFSSSFSGLNDLSSSEKQSGYSIYRQEGINHSRSDKHSSGYGNREQHSGSPGYGYLSSENQTPAKYDFEYEVKDKYGNDYGHKEIRNGENTQGVYKVLLPDGRRQVVHYEADSHGYRPMVTYEEAGTYSNSRQSTKYDNQGYQY